MKGDVTTVLSHGRTHACFEQFLDRRHDLFRTFFDEPFRQIDRRLARRHDGRTGHEMLHDDAQHSRLHMVPFQLVGLGDGHEIVAEEDALDARYAKQLFAQRRDAVRSGSLWKVDGTRLRDDLAGQEFQCRGVGRGFGLNEHEGVRESGVRASSLSRRARAFNLTPDRRFPRRRACGARSSPGWGTRPCW